MSLHEPSQSASTRWAIGLGLVTILGPASIDMYLPSLPAMATDLGTDYPTMQLTLTVFLLALGGGQILFGPVIDALGRRRPLLLALLTYVLTSIWAALAQSPESLIMARFLQGLAASLALVTAMSSVCDRAEGVRAAQIFALLMTIQGLGPVIAPALGGLIGTEFGWRMVFYVLAGFGVAALLSSSILLPESLPLEKRMPLNLRVITQTYNEILRDRLFLLPAMALAAVFVFLFTYIGGSAYAYQQEYKLSAAHFGLVFGATGLAVLAGAMGSAKLVTLVRIEKLALAGALALLVGAVVALFSAISGIGLAGIVLGMFISLAGLGISEATLMSIALSTRQTALGVSAAVLGAAPLMLGAAATPMAARIVVYGSAPWVGMLVIIGGVASLLTLLSIRMLARHGVQASLAH